MAREIYEKEDSMRKAIPLVVALLLFVAWGYSQDYGSIYGTVTDEEGTPLPGVTVAISSSFYPQKSAITTATGGFRFLRLPIAKDYTLKAELQGFKTVIREKIEVAYNENVRFDFVMAPATLEEEITVVAEVPLIDKKKAPVGIHITTEKLMALPTGRNIWTIAALSPGMLTSRTDVGGNEGGQQQGMYAYGSGGGTSYNLDGADMTDSVRGSMIIYFKVSNYEEVNINYGVNDITTFTGGTNINIISKRGGNNYSGNFHYNFTRGKDWERTNLIPEWKGVYVGAGINPSAIYGFDLGGPIVRDKAWFYLSWGDQEIRKRSEVGTEYHTSLEGGYAKVNLQLAPNTRLELMAEYDNKIQLNRMSYGALLQSPDTYADQYSPKYVYKMDFEQTVGNLLWATNVMYMTAGWSLIADNWGSGEYEYYQQYPTFYASGNGGFLDCWVTKFYLRSIGTYFADDVLGGDHEIKFGGDYIYYTSWTLTKTENDVELNDYANKYLKKTGIDPWIQAGVQRDNYIDVAYGKYSLFVQDSMTFGRWSASLGLRYDHETSWLKDLNVDASDFMKSYLPAVSIDKIDPGQAFTSLSPRFSISYDIFGTGKDIIKLSIARYGSSSTGSLASFVNPTGSSSITLLWIDANGDKRVAESELWGFDWSTNTKKDRNDPKYWLGYGGFDPNNPLFFQSPNKFDPDYNSPLKDEVMLSYQKELFPDFAARLELIYNRYHHQTWTLGMYADGSLESKSDYYLVGHISVPEEDLDADYYGRDGRFVGSYRTNSKNSERYIAAQVVLTKRLSNKWMMDASFTLADWRQYYNGDFTNPNNVDFYDGNWADRRSSRWIAKLSGLYQLPLGFNISGSITGNEGNILSRGYRVVVGTQGVSSATIYAGKFGDTRLPSIWMINLRLEKVFRFAETGTAGLYLEAYNLTNTNAALGKESRIDRSSYMDITSIVNPTVFRLGVRFRF